MCRDDAAGLSVTDECTDGLRFGSTAVAGPGLHTGALCRRDGVAVRADGTCLPADGRRCGGPRSLCCADCRPARRRDRSHPGRRGECAGRHLLHAHRALREYACGNRDCVVDVARRHDSRCRCATHAAASTERVPRLRVTRLPAPAVQRRVHGLLGRSPAAPELPRRLSESALRVRPGDRPQRQHARGRWHA